MPPIKLGIIGCGIAARKLHLPALQKLKQKYEIVMVCNHTEPKAREFAALAGNIPYVLDYHELLQNPTIEAVDIVLPIHLNYHVTREALEAGKHVIVEKPLAANLLQAKRMLSFPEKYPHVMMVAENFRYRKTFHRVKALLNNHQIGTPYAIFWNIFYHVDQTNPYARTKWRLNHQYPGGFITDGGVHNIAAIRFLFGEIITGNAFTKSINPQIGKLDTMSLQFTTDSGVNGVFNVFFSANGYFENRVIILGDQGSIIVENNTIVIRENNKSGTREEITDDDGGYIAEFEDFYQAIRSGKMVASTFQEAYNDLRVIIKALQSAKRGRIFKIQ